MHVHGARMKLGWPLMILASLAGAEAAAGPTITLTGSYYTQKKLQQLAPNTVVECKKATFYLGLADKTTANNYILQVRSSVDTLVKNVLIIGDIPLNNAWNDQYKNNNSAAFSFMESHGGTLEHAEISRAWDALRAARDSKGTYIFRRVYVRDWRDDVIETDTGYPNTLVEDCLFDGGYTGFSSRQGANSNAGNASSRWLRIRNVLLRLKKFLGNKSKYGSTPVHSCPVKLSSNCQSIEVTNSVWAVESTLSGCWGSNWNTTFKNKLKISKNNLLLWLGSCPFPAKIWVPPGFTTMCGPKANSEWTKRRNAWLALFNSGTSGTPAADAGIQGADASVATGDEDGGSGGELPAADAGAADAGAGAEDADGGADAVESADGPAHEGQAVLGGSAIGGCALVGGRPADGTLPGGRADGTLPGIGLIFLVCVGCSFFLRQSMLPVPLRDRITDLAALRRSAAREDLPVGRGTGTCPGLHGGSLSRQGGGDPEAARHRSGRVGPGGARSGAARSG